MEKNNGYPSYLVTGIDMIEKIIVPFNLTDIQRYMAVLLDLARGRSDLPGSEYNRRGYLTLMNGETGQIAFTLPFGEIPSEKIEKYFEYSQEKAERLFSIINMHLPHMKHTSSFQSRNEAEQKYGGAIYLNCHTNISIFSFSGMPELIDEAMMLVLAERLRQDNHLKVFRSIEACQRNPYWEQLYTDFNQKMKVTA